jgi:hypothetical protein
MLADIYNWFTEGFEIHGLKRCQGSPRRIKQLGSSQFKELRYPLVRNRIMSQFTFVDRDAELMRAVCSTDEE